jgi:uncharacterized protein (TIGR03000 family)
MTPPAGTPAPAPAPAPIEKGGKVGGGDEANAAARATIIVSLPADARLLVDGYLTTSTSAQRVFTSPELAPGQDYHYTLQAEIVRDGRVLTASERVTVRAGIENRVTLSQDRFATNVAAR